MPETPIPSHHTPNDELALRIEAVKSMWKRFIAASNGTHQLSETLQDCLTKLAQEAETLGVGRLSDAARTMVAQLNLLPPDPSLWFPEARAELSNSYHLIAASQWQGASLMSHPPPAAR